MKCNICDEDFPSKYYFAEEGICKTCSNLSPEEKNAKIHQKENDEIKEVEEISDKFQDVPEIDFSKFNIFSSRGRINRLTYFFITFLIDLFGFIFITIIFQQQENAAGGTSSSLPGIIFLIMVILNFIQAAKRFHDLGQPGTDIWMLFVPIFNIYWALVLLFKKGEIGPNKYGSDPLKQ